MPVPARVAYLDPVSGVSGDMLLGAIVAAGVEVETLSDALAGLGLPGWRLRAESVRRAGFAATKVTVEVERGERPRTLGEILELIEGSGIPAEDRERARAVFRLLGEAEAAVHGHPSAEAGHLHEVGAVDALVDVVGTVAGLHLLGVRELYCGPLPLGGGSVRASHGRLPVPPPATLEIAARAGLPLAAPSEGEPQMELVTPTGAALVATLARFERPTLTLERVGVGAGGRDPEGWPNVLRLWLGRATAAGDDAPATRPLVLIETNVDDMPPEHLPYLEERLREAGARDVWWSAVQMKKGRPGMQISAVLEPADEAAVALALLRHSSTLGVRATPLTRYEAAREVLRFESSLGRAAVKVKRLPGEPPSVAPEYEDARALAQRHDLPLAEVYRRLRAEGLSCLAEE